MNNFRIKPRLVVLIACAFVHSSVGAEIKNEETRIVGGEPAAPGEFPYQVFIENVFNSSEILKCGGAIYSAEYVITAAHCMYFKDTHTFANPKKIWITAGTTDLEEGANAPSGDINRDKQLARVVEIIPHPKFEFKKHEGDLGTIPTYDIVLLRMYPPLKLNERTQPVPLAPSHVIKGLGTVTGWGRQDPYGKWTKQLRKVDIPLVEWERCKKLFKGYATVTEDMFCTGTTEGGLTPCNGDSGGPVVCKYDNDPEKRHHLCGIASFGPNRCPNYSVYTRVSKYVSWVEEQVAMRQNSSVLQ